MNLLGNGECDPACFNEACNWDSPDCNSCASGCSLDNLKSDICVDACNVAACAYSMGSCGTATCEEHGCSMSMLGNMKCEPVCNNAACQFDGGDCDICVNRGCTNDKLANGKCDVDCNYPEC